jgi:hypothetical protein
VLAIDQLLNSVYLVGKSRMPDSKERDQLLDLLLQELGE